MRVRYLRMTPEEKLDILRAVESSQVTLKEALIRLGVPFSTYYRWKANLERHGIEYKGRFKSVAVGTAVEDSDTPNGPDLIKRDWKDQRFFRRVLSQEGQRGVYRHGSVDGHQISRIET